MDSLKSLLSKGQYDLVIDLTKETRNPEELLIRIAALTAKNKLIESLEIIENNKEDLYKFSPGQTIKSHLGLLHVSNNYLKYKEAYDDYANRPYVSQEIEEILRDADATLKEILKSKEDQNKSLPKEDVLKEIKKTKNPVDLQKFLGSINNENYDFFHDSLKEYLKNKSRIKRMRLQVLFCLMKFAKDENVSFLNGTKEVNINTLKDNPPFMFPEFHKLEEKIFSVSKNITVSSIAVSLLSDYFLSIYPDHTIKDEDKFLLSILTLAKKFLKDDKELELNSPLEGTKEEIDKLNKKILLSISKLDK